MAFANKVLGEGQLPNSIGVLYTAVAQGALVKFLHLHNTAATGETAVLYLRAASTARIIGRAVLTQDEQADVLDKDAAMSMEPGDTIEGESTNAGAVDYVITGAEVS
jgi:hypothetical protein